MDQKMSFQNKRSAGGVVGNYELFKDVRMLLRIISGAQIQENRYNRFKVPI